MYLNLQNSRNNPILNLFPIRLSDASPDLEENSNHEFQETRTNPRVNHTCMSQIHARVCAHEIHIWNFLKQQFHLSNFNSFSPSFDFVLLLDSN